MKSKKPYILITCEHADYKIPSFIKTKLPKSIDGLSFKNSHKTYDKYAFAIAKELTKTLKKHKMSSDLIYYPYTRLLIDANRTKNNSGFYSNLSYLLNATELKKLEDLYDSYLDLAFKKVNQHLNKGQKVYVFSIHSFTPVYKNKKRKTDIGVLFRNNITKENQLANIFIKEFNKINPKIKVHKNLPYRGHTDCMLNYILDQNKKNLSLNGLFFEFNQNLVKKNISKIVKELGFAINKNI